MTRFNINTPVPHGLGFRDLKVGELFVQCSSDGQPLTSLIFLKTGKGTRIAINGADNEEHVEVRECLTDFWVRRVASVDITLE